MSNGAPRQQQEAVEPHRRRRSDEETGQQVVPHLALGLQAAAKKVEGAQTGEDEQPVHGHEVSLLDGRGRHRQQEGGQQGGTR